jgi:hypothetical protein
MRIWNAFWLMFNFIFFGSIGIIILVPALISAINFWTRVLDIAFEVPPMNP